MPVSVSKGRRISSPACTASAAISISGTNRVPALNFFADDIERRDQPVLKDDFDVGSGVDLRLHQLGNVFFLVFQNRIMNFGYLHVGRPLCISRSSLCL